MFYFDKKYLKQYMESGLKLKVYVSSRYLTITDPSDLSKSDGEGMDGDGEMKKFNYKDIDHVKIGSRIFTMDDLNGNDSKMPDELNPKQE